MKPEILDPDTVLIASHNCFCDPTLARNQVRLVFASGRYEIAQADTPEFRRRTFRVLPQVMGSA